MGKECGRQHPELPEHQPLRRRQRNGAATVVVLALSLALGPLGVSDAFAAAAPEDAASVPAPTSGPPSASSPAASPLEAARNLVHRLQEDRNGVSGTPAEADPVGARTPSGDAPAATPTEHTQAPAAASQGAEPPEAAGGESPASTPRADSPGAGDTGGVVLGRSNSPRSRRPEHRPAGSFRAPPASAGDASSTPVRGERGTQAPPVRPAPSPPDDPRGGLSAGVGASAGSISGGLTVVLIALMGFAPLAAPTRRSAAPLDRPRGAPFLPQLDRPG